MEPVRLQSIANEATRSDNTIDTTISLLREKMQRIEGRGPATALQHSAQGTAEGRVEGGVESGAGRGHAGVAPAPSWLAPHLAGGGFPRGTATQVSACPAALVDILAALTAQGGCAAVVNHPRLALAAVEAAGGDLERLVIVPDASPHAAAVVATLAEGMDMVVFSASSDANARGELHSGFVRPVDARVNKSTCALLVSGATWPSARHHVEVDVHAVHGLGRGSGRVRGIELVGKTWGKAQPPQRFQATIGAPGIHVPEHLAHSTHPAQHERAAQ